MSKKQNDENSFVFFAAEGSESGCRVLLEEQIGHAKITVVHGGRDNVSVCSQYSVHLPHIAVRSARSRIGIPMQRTSAPNC